MHIFSLDLLAHLRDYPWTCNADSGAGDADLHRLLHLEQEPRGNVDPPAWWPSYAGDIVFDNVTIRYSQHLDPALSDISVRIPGGSTTALLGRTGD